MPPPPPPAPPPMPKLGAGNAPKSNCVQPDRNALLSQIRKGTNLKKAETNDKSAPLIDGSKTTSNGPIKRNDTNKSNGPFPLIPPGGLFAQGIPKLRPTVPRSGDNSPLSSLVSQSLKSDIGSSSLDHLRVGQLGNSRSQPPSPVFKPRVTYSATAPNSIAPNSVTAESASRVGNPNFPDDVAIKGPAPAPPPQNQKPVFKNNTSAEPKHPTVKRSVSQTNLGQRPRLRPPPNVKPPPPPKANIVAPQTAPPPPPSKPPNILRRQSFGVGEGRIVNSKLSISSTITNGSAVKSTSLPPPPPPPRNNSAPNDLSRIGSSPNQWGKMNIAPPPPPPNRVGAVPNRGTPIRPPPPRAPAPPPPPSQHQFPAPPSQMKATSAALNVAPPPPVRVSSMKPGSEFEQRFVDRFQLVHSLPKPDRYPNTQKAYPSKAARQKQSQRRQPPPPPPQAGQPLLHIQLDSGIFSSYSSYS